VGGGGVYVPSSRGPYSSCKICPYSSYKRGPYYSWVYKCGIYVEIVV